jgi:hypothetical protein
MIIKPNFIGQFLKLGSYKLILEDGQIKTDYLMFWFFKRKPKCLNSNKIIVFDTGVNIFGHKLTTGHKPGGGSNNKISVKGLSRNDVNLIKEYVILNGAQILQNDGETLKTSIPFLMPSRWLSAREKIIIGDNGIGHIRKGWFKTRESFLPYDSINMYFYDGIFEKNVLILGDTTISLVENLSNTNNEKLKKVLLEKGVTSTKGRKYLPALLSFRRGLPSDVLIATEKGILFKSKKLIGGQSNLFLGYDEITKFKKHGWYKIFAPISIEGRRVDARKGEGGIIYIFIEGIAFYRWNTLFFFDGSLKSTLKSNCR